MNYLVNEVSEKLGITKHAIYYYEKTGLLPDIKRNKNGHREYSDLDIAWIHLIIRLRDINMPIKLIREYVSLLKNEKSTLKQRKNALLLFEEKVNNDIKNYIKIQKLIKKKLEYYINIEKNKINNEVYECYNYKEDFENFKSILEENLNE